MTSLRVGLLGVGRAGAVHRAAWALVPGAEIAAICDLAPAARAEARAHGIPVFAVPAEMMVPEVY